MLVILGKAQALFHSDVPVSSAMTQYAQQDYDAIIYNCISYTGRLKMCTTFYRISYVDVWNQITINCSDFQH